MLTHCVEKVIIDLECLTISLKAESLEKLSTQYLEMTIPTGALGLFYIKESYRPRKSQSGAVVLETPSKKQDLHNLPAGELKALVQSVVWRDDYLNGASIRQIAEREKCSLSHVGATILESFDRLRSLV